MPTEITMPKLSDTMEEGTLLKWRIQEGDKVTRGDVIAEVETDKAAMEMEAFEDGEVRELRVQEGETVTVGTVIAVLAPAEEGKRPKGKEEEKKEETKEAPAKEEKRAAPEAEEKPEPPEEKKEPEREEKTAYSERREMSPEEEKKVAERPTIALSDLAAAPAARKLAEEKGVDLSRVRGTGPGGRIVPADVERALEEGVESPPRRRKGGRERPQKAEAHPVPAAARTKSPQIRRIIASKMTESWQNAPHFFVTIAVDLSDVVRFRKSIGASINDFIILAAARCLREHPPVNSLWREGEIEIQEEVNIALAVATDRGLYNPVLRDCDRLSLSEIHRRATELVEKAHRGKLGQNDLEGGTFTISNMGMLGVDSFTAIITPPQAAVLAVGALRYEAVADEQGEMEILPRIHLTLSSDHRILDGADAAAFLSAMKRYLEAPVTLIAGDLSRKED